MDLLDHQSTCLFAAGTPLPPPRPADNVEKADRTATGPVAAVCVARRPGASPPAFAALAGDR
jgi:hypothetical protein